MSDKEKKEGSVIPGAIGAVAGAGIGYGLTARHVANKGVSAVLDGAKTTEGFAKSVTEALGKNTELAKQRGLLTTLKKNVDNAGADIRGLKFTDVGKGLHTMEVSANNVKFTIPGIKKLPDGVAANQLLGGDPAKAVFAEGGFAAKLADKEKGSLVSGIKKAAGKGFGIKNAGGWDRTGIIAGTVVAATVCAVALNAMFGGKGKHTSKVEAERAAEPAVGAAR